MFVLSDRQQYGLRGPVRTCREETIFPGPLAADGKREPEFKVWSKLEYNLDGRLTERLFHNADGSEPAMQYTYDDSGRVLKVRSGKEGQPLEEKVYCYSEDGRLASITDSRNPDNPVVFRYDDRGRKTKLQTSRPQDYIPNLASAGPPFACADRPPNLPGGGTATTIYDEQDRPVEVQVRDAQGELMSRVTRKYDQQGRIAEEHHILENPENIIPFEVRSRILKESGRSLLELRSELRRVLGGQGPSAIAYDYDPAGRIVQTRRRVFNREQRIETSYNEHGDKAVEITEEKRIGGQDAQPDSRPLENSEVRYSYEYDQGGNWTKEIISHRSRPNGELQPSSERRRTVSYY